MLENSANSQGEIFLDKFLSAIKLFFLYAPGAMLLHMVGMFIKVFILYGESFPNLFPELIGATFSAQHLLHNFAIVHRAAVTPDTMNNRIDAAIVIVANSLTNCLFVSIISNLIAA